MDIEENQNIELKEVKIEDYLWIKKFFDLRRPETSDSNILDLYLWERLLSDLVLYNGTRVDMGR